MRIKYIGFSLDGHRCGETHQRATLSDNDCELIRQLAESGMSYIVIAHKFNIVKSTVYRIVNYRSRATPAITSKAIKVM